jgi:DNA-binding MarR family transcriptional regulator
VEQRVIALREHHLDVWHAQLWLSAAAPTAPANVDTLALAIVSADLNARPVGQLVQGIFERLDRKRFEVFCFSLELYDGSEPARRMIEAVTEFQFVKGLDSRLVSEMINSVQAHIMIDLAKRDGEDGEDGILIRERPTQQDIASMIGTSRETVSRVLSDFQRAGLVEMRGREILLTRKFTTQTTARA